MLSRRMSDWQQSDTSRFVASANRRAAQPVRRKSREQIAGISGRQGLRGELFSIENGPYPLRT